MGGVCLISQKYIVITLVYGILLASQWAFSEEPARVLGPDVAAQIQQIFSDIGANARFDGASIEESKVMARVCDGPSCGQIELTDPQLSCKGTVAGHWCVSFENRAFNQTIKSAVLAKFESSDYQPWLSLAAPGKKWLPPGSGPFRAFKPHHIGNSTGDLWFNGIIPVAMWLLFILGLISLGFDLWNWESRSTGKRLLLLAAIAFLLAIVLRLILGTAGPINFAEIERIPLFTRHTWYRFAAAWGAPLAWAIGDPVVAQQWISLLFSAGTVALVAILGTMWWGPLTGIGAGILAAFSPDLIRWSQVLDAGVTAAFMGVLAFVATEAVRQRPSIRSAVVAGIFWIFAILSRPESVLLVVPLAVLGLCSIKYLRGQLHAVSSVIVFTILLALAGVLRIILDEIATPVVKPTFVSFDLFASVFKKQFYRLVIAPESHSVIIVVLGALGTLVGWGRGRLVALFAAWFLTPLATAIAGFQSMEVHHECYGLVGWPFMALLGGAAVGWFGKMALKLAPKAQKVIAPLLLAALTTAMLWMAFSWDWEPDPLPVQYQFLAKVAPKLPDNSQIWFAGEIDQPNDADVWYPLEIEGRANPDRVTPECTDKGYLFVRLITKDFQPRSPGECDLYWLRGAWATVTDESDLAEAKLKASGWDFEPFYLEKVVIRDAFSGRPKNAEMGLWKLHPAVGAQELEHGNQTK